MPTITIDGNDYTAWADVAAADEYLAADFGADAWRAEQDADQKARALVTATRLLGTALCLDGVKMATVAEADLPDGVINGSIVLAKLIHAGSTVTSSGTTAGNIKRQQAGSVSVEYFAPFVLTDTGRWPVELTDLVGGYFCGGEAGIGGAQSFGTCGTSITDECHSYEPGWPPA